MMSKRRGLATTTFQSRYSYSLGIVHPNNELLHSKGWWLFEVSMMASTG